MSRWTATTARLVLAALLRIGWSIKRQAGGSHGASLLRDAATAFVSVATSRWNLAFRQMKASRAPMVSAAMATPSTTW